MKGARAHSVEKPLAAGTLKHTRYFMNSRVTNRR
jgi:hypothetical protein